MTEDPDAARDQRDREMDELRDKKDRYELALRQISGYLKADLITPTPEARIAGSALSNHNLGEE